MTRNKELEDFTGCCSSGNLKRDLRLGKVFKNSIKLFFESFRNTLSIAIQSAYEVFLDY